MSFIREQVVKRFARSSGWRKVRNSHIKKHPTCAVCGTRKSPEAHHIKPFRTFPDLELDPSNLVTLCGKKCHFAFGHLFYWRAINSNIVQTIIYMREEIRRRNI